MNYSVENQNSRQLSETELKASVSAMLDSVINPVLQNHNGSAELTYLEDGICGIRFLGACASCMSLTDTFNDIVKEPLLRKFPELKDVVVDTTVSAELLDFARSLLQHKH